MDSDPPIDEPQHRQASPREKVHALADEYGVSIDDMSVVESGSNPEVGSVSFVSS